MRDVFALSPSVAETAVCSLPPLPALRLSFGGFDDRAPSRFLPLPSSGGVAVTAADIAARALTGVTVAGLAGVAGAISFSHMADLAAEHGQVGWRAVAFPVSVDGLEVVASLYLVVCHRTGRPAGWLPWLMLVAGTAASLAANVAVGGHDPIGRVLAGWPALSMLVSVKLLFSMFEPAGTVPDGPGTDGTMRVVRGTGRPSTRDDHRTGRTVPGASGTVAGPSGAVRQEEAKWAALAGNPALIPAARVAHAALEADGRRPSRDALAARMRADGHPVSNARACALLRLLRAEHTFSGATAAHAARDPGGAVLGGTGAENPYSVAITSAAGDTGRGTAPRWEAGASVDQSTPTRLPTSTATTTKTRENGTP